MRTMARFSVLSLVLLTGAAAAQRPSPQPAAQPAPQLPAKPAANNTATRSNSDDGGQVFQRNCSRCHKAPEAIPPSVSGTVALHMRIRAGLSDKDYRRLLAFLNP